MKTGAPCRAPCALATAVPGPGQQKGYPLDFPSLQNSDTRGSRSRSVNAGDCTTTRVCVYNFWKEFS